MIDSERPSPALERGSPSGPPWAWPMRGELVEMVLHSRVLQGNPLGDPAERPLWVYLPPAYQEDPERRLPVIYLLQGLSGQIDMWKARSPFRRTPIELFDALFADPAVPPCLLVFVDCWTRLGGSQFLDSPGTGRYHTYLCEEVVPAIDDQFRTLAKREHRAVAGKSSGGYGAMISALLRPDLFGALASHAGDALFEFCYLPDFPLVVRQLRDRFQGSFAKFWDGFPDRPAFSQPGDVVMLSTWCMAACYSASADGSPELPFEEATGILRPEVWQRWLAWDPVRLLGDHPEAATSLRGAFIEGGRGDEYYLDVGASAVAVLLRRAGVDNLRLELFEGGHRGIEYRYPISVRFLAETLSS